MDPASAKNTTFIKLEGKFKFKVMQFWFTGTPATSQRLMDLVMSDLNLEICMVYLDDMIAFIAFSLEVSEHLNRL